jgi:EAL and modified HD-GYP domain-containing signal transduction protein
MPDESKALSTLSLVDAGLRQSRLLARQPILDATLSVVAYELLFRSGWDNSFAGDGEDATRQILDNLLVTGADGLSSNTLAFVNCPREALVGGLFTLLPPRQVVLEILETVKPDEEVVSACRSLKKQGYRIALDDFEQGDGMKPLIELADYIKIDFRASDAGARASIRRQLQRSHAALVAEKVETEAEFATALDEGFSYFQGYFFCHPTIVARDEVPLNVLNSAQLMIAMSRSPLDQDEVERIVKADAPLCFRLLRLVNSAVYGMRGEIRSVRRALLVLGEDELRKLAAIAVSGSRGQQQPHALTFLSLQRARLCELLAPHLHQDPIEQYLLGLFSLLDAILQAPMSAILKSLPLRPPVRAALLGEQNSVSIPLSIARSYETGDWDSSPAFKEILYLGPELLNRLCIEAARWAETALQSQQLPA